MALAGKKKPRKVLFPADFLNKRQRRIYQKGGRISISNLLEDYSIDKLRTMEKEEAIPIVRDIKTNFSVKKISDAWGASSYHLYKLFYDYVPEMIQSVPGSKGAEAYGTGSSSETQGSQPEKLHSFPPRRDSGSIEEKLRQLARQGFSVKLFGDFNGKEITDRLQGITLILGEEKKYKIIIEVDEII